MSLYRLLRNNKETGPFSEEEMIAHGFKPYDLIWVEGRSAGWRYPSEIPAFRDYAPAVEEQPYDRFFRKEPPQQHFAFSKENQQPREAVVATQPNPPAAAPVVSAVAPVSSDIPSTSKESLPEIIIHPEALQGKKIHVTLPSGNTVSLQQLVEQSAARDAEATTAKKAADPMPAEKVTVAKVAAPARENTNQPIAPIFAPAVEQEQKPLAAAPVRRRAALASMNWGLVAASVIGIATLVGLGVMIGLSMSKDKKEAAMAQSQPIHPRNQQELSRNAAANTQTTTSGVDNMHTGLVALPDEAALPHAPGDNHPVKTIVKTIVAQPGKNVDDKTNSKPTDNTADKAKPKDEPVVTREPAKPVLNVEKEVFLQTNNFKTGAFGGISSLECTLVNTSQVPLESVEVEIDYVQANSKVYKTEKLHFKDVPANSQATIPAPSSSRGVKIISRVVKANARETGGSNTAKS